VPTGVVSGAPNGIRTRAAALKGRCPRPLDDGGRTAFAAMTLGARRRGLPQHRGQPACPAKRSRTPPITPSATSRSEPIDPGPRHRTPLARPVRHPWPGKPRGPGLARATGGQHRLLPVTSAALSKTIMMEPLAQLLIIRRGRHSTNDSGSLLPVTGPVRSSRDRSQRVTKQLHCARRHRNAEVA
jgi:hypothetical protein